MYGDAAQESQQKELAVEHRLSSVACVVLVRFPPLVLNNAFYL